MIPVVCAAGEGEAEKREGEPKVWTEVLEKGDEARSRHTAKLLKELPEDHKLRVQFHKVWDMSRKDLVEMVKMSVPLDEKGRPDGVERHYRPWRGIQRTVTYEKGERNGLEEVYDGGYGSKQPRVVIEWKSDQMQKKTIFHPNGQVSTTVRYREGKPTGESCSFDPKGRLTRVIPYVDGKRHGDMVSYWPETGGKRRVVPCLQGRVQGTVREFYEDGSRKAELSFHDDSLHGVECRWDKDGKLSRVRYWINGELVPEGVFRERFEK
jgi:hypothetical protein